VLAWHDGLAPGHNRAADGTLEIGGMRADDLAADFGTPALVLDLHTLDRALHAILAACGRYNIRVSYAAKALLVTRLARRLASRNVGIDVASHGELITAERGGFGPERITLHGAAKSDDELREAMRGRAGRVVIDSVDELRRLRDLGPMRTCDVLLRLNTGIEAHTHEFIRTAGDDSKFGIAPHEEEEAFALIDRQPLLRVRGVHAHIGSQIFDAEPFVANAQLLAAALKRLRERGFPAYVAVIGGGFGVPMHPEEPDVPIEIGALVDAIVAAVPDDIALEIEPGRAIVGPAGTSLYRVMAIKRFDRRTFVVVDGSMADNPRPALYGASHHVTAVRATNAPHHPVTLCGRSCENDELGSAALPTDLAAGDLLAVCTTGAYTYSMASNYNRFPRPPIVAVERGQAELFARRETDDDLLRADLD
jgi:diaminopimelate decarboxylase